MRSVTRLPAVPDPASRRAVVVPYDVVVPYLNQ
jgi:hypothetical protein